MSMRAYRRAGTNRSAETRRRIRAAVRELLAEGTFHTSTVEQVAERAGVSRATVYQHFPSRVELVDAMCETFDENPALLRLRETVGLPDAAAALDETIADGIRFWSSEDAVLRQLYGVAAIDPAAEALVARQRADRRHEYGRLVGNLERARLLRKGVGRERALTLLLVLSSYETYRELREAGLSDARAIATLQGAARDLLF
jgi:AcrR family transcriptional regulator